MKLSVIIVNYNVKYFLEQCLVSLQRAVEGIDTEIFVVDNNSQDNSLEYLKPRFPNVIFIENKENVGFSKANNQAIRLAKGEYILLLNPDTILTENLIQDCIELMDSKPDVGGLGVRMLGSKGNFAFESRRGFPSPLTALYKFTGLCGLFPYSHRFGKYHMRYLDENEVNEIEVISGAYMFLRKEALDKSGLLDETFFMYGEDIDLSYRICLAGYKNYYIPSCLLHYKGESTKKGSYKYVYQFYNAMYIFFKKHYPNYRVVGKLVKLLLYCRAALALFNRMLRRFRYNLNVYNKTKPICFLVLGGEKAIRDIRLLCENNKFVADHHYVKANELTTPCGHLNLDLSLERFTHVVYDNSAFSYKKIMEILSTANAEQKLELGMYSTDTKVLITAHKAYR